MPPDPESDDVMRALLQQSRSLPPLDPTRTAQARTAVHGAWTNATRTPSRVWWYWSGLAAAVILVVGMYSLWRAPGRDQQAPADPTTHSIVATVGFVTGSVQSGAASLRTGEQLSPGATITTGAAGRGMVALADGAEVRLDRSTTVRLLSKQQVALDAGALYIDTTARRGPGVPIEVVARGVIARDIGTRFEVRLIEGRVRVRVRDGIVQVRQRADRRDVGAASELLLTPTGMEAGPLSASGPDWEWTVLAASAPLVDGRTLAEFLAWVAHEGGRAVRFADPSLERVSAAAIVYGNVEGLSVEDALDVVLPSCGLAYRLDAETIVIVARDGTRNGR